MTLNWIEAPDAAALAVRLGDAVAAQLRTAIDLAGEASSTPKPVFQHLSACALDWSRVTVTLADERWVPASHADSNEALVRNTLLVDQAASARFVSLYLPDQDPHSALAEIDRAVAAICRPFTVVILGMGEDGHTASLFPATDGLEAAMDLDASASVAVMQPQTVPQTRISLTRRALLDSTQCLVHITGASKRQVLETALSDPVDTRLPIARVVDARPAGVSVYWSP